MAGGPARDGAKGRPALQPNRSADYIPTSLSSSIKHSQHVQDVLAATSAPSKYSSAPDLVPFVNGRPVALSASAQNGHPDTPKITVGDSDPAQHSFIPPAPMRASSIRGLALGSSSDLRGNASGYNPGSWVPNQHSTKFNYINFPCDPMPPSFIRSRIFGDAEAVKEFDPTVWYQASAEEVARDKERALERERLRIEREEKELRRRLEKGKNKAIVKGGRKSAPKRRKAVREKRTRQIRPAVQAATTTRFGKVAGTGESESFATSLFISCHALPNEGHRGCSVLLRNNIRGSKKLRCARADPPLAPLSP